MLKWHQKTVGGAIIATVLNQLKEEGVDTLTAKVISFSRGQSYLYQILYLKEFKEDDKSIGAPSSNPVVAEAKGSDPFESITKFVKSGKSSKGNT